MLWGRGGESWTCNKKKIKNRSFRWRLGLSLFVKACQNLKMFWESSSYSLDLVSNYHRVLFANLGSGFGFVVVWTVVLIGITVKTTEQIPTATVKTWKATGKKKQQHINHERLQQQHIPWWYVNCTDRLYVWEWNMHRKKGPAHYTCTKTTRGEF